MAPRGLELGSVWAPLATSVELVVQGDSHQLEPSPAGIWSPPSGTSSTLVPGARYGFRLDGSVTLPDPRSRWQPDGPAGLSAVDDSEGFEWRAGDFEPEPWSRAVLYEVHVGTFSASGTFRGAIEHLDHLVELGATHVELMPLGAFVGRWGWGYDGVCWWAPHSAYGSPADLRSLVDACHERGLAVLLDVVFNHLGPEGAVLDRFGPYTRAADTPWGRAVDLDSQGSRPVRDHIIECSLMWLADYRIDGLRLDAVHALCDQSERHIVAELTARVDELSGDLGRELVVVAEWDRHDPVPVIDRRDQGWGCRAQWADDLHHALHVTLTGESQGYYADAAASSDPLGEALDLIYLPRRATGEPASEGSAAGLSRTCFVVCLQNHDQIGNRAAGERITHLAPLDAVMSALPLVLLGPSVPLLFQGEEWAASSPFPFFADHTPELAEAVRAGRLAEFPDHVPSDIADPEAAATYEAARLQWAEATGGDHGRVLAWYRGLLRLRRTRSDLVGGTPARYRHPDDGPEVMLMERGSLLVACNLGPVPWSSAANLEPLSGVRPLLAWRDDGGEAMCLEPGNAAVFQITG